MKRLMLFVFMLTDEEAKRLNELHIVVGLCAGCLAKWEHSNVMEVQHWFDAHTCTRTMAAKWINW